MDCVLVLESYKILIYLNFNYVTETFSQFGRKMKQLHNIWNQMAKFITNLSNRELYWLDLVSEQNNWFYTGLGVGGAFFWNCVI